MATLFGMFPFLRNSIADSGYQGPKFAKGLAKFLPHLDIGNRQAFRSGQRICGLAKTLDRRAHDCLAQSLPKARQGLGVPQPKSARVLAPRLNPPHAQKTMQSGVKSPDRLSGVLTGNNNAKVIRQGLRLAFLAPHNGVGYQRRTVRQTQSNPEESSYRCVGFSAEFRPSMLQNGSSQLLVQQLKEVAYSFERLRIAIADIDHAIAFALQRLRFRLAKPTREERRSDSLGADV